MAQVQEEKQNHNTPSTIHSNTLSCFFGCLALSGCRSKLVRRMAFAPPRKPGYKIETSPSGHNLIFMTGMDPPINVTELSQLLSRIQVSFIRITRKYNSDLASFLIENKAKGGLSHTSTLLFSHGNSTDIGYMLPHLYFLADYLGVNVFAYDYSGYGLSKGTASEKTIYKDIRRAWDYLTETLAVNPAMIILYGQSIGSAPACHLASQNNCQPGGVILHSAIASGMRIFVHDLKHTPWFDVFRNINRIKGIRCPVYLIHGLMDKQISYQHSLQLFKVASSDKRTFQTETSSDPKSTELGKSDDGRIWYWWVPDADHNDIEEKQPGSHYRQLGEFIEYVTNERRKK